MAPFNINRLHNLSAVINWLCPRKSVQRRQPHVSDSLASHVAPNCRQAGTCSEAPDKAQVLGEGEWKRNMIQRGEAFLRRQPMLRPSF